MVLRTDLQELEVNQSNNPRLDQSVDSLFRSNKTRDARENLHRLVGCANPDYSLICRFTMRGRPVSCIVFISLAGVYLT